MFTCGISTQNFVTTFNLACSYLSHSEILRTWIFKGVHQRFLRLSSEILWNIWPSLHCIGPDRRRCKIDILSFNLQGGTAMDQICYNLLSSLTPSPPFTFPLLIPSFSSSSSSHIFSWFAFHQTPTSKRVETARQAAVTPHMK